MQRQTAAVKIAKAVLTDQIRYPVELCICACVFEQIPALMYGTEKIAFRLKALFWKVVDVTNVAFKWNNQKLLKPVKHRIRLI